MKIVSPSVRRLLVSLAPWLLVLLALGGVEAQDGANRAGLVVQYGDGHVETACVAFAEPELDGVQLLERSGLPVVTQSIGIGAAVCKIGPDGCDYPAEGCFCTREGASSIYWAFYTRQGEGWAYASLGAGSTPARDGDVHGWAWGQGESGSGVAPPLVDLETICGPASSQVVTTAPAATAAPVEPAPSVVPTTASEATPAPTAVPAPTPAAEPPTTPRRGYLAFGALVAILIVGAAVLARRR